MEAEGGRGVSSSKGRRQSRAEPAISDMWQNTCRAVQGWGETACIAVSRKQVLELSLVPGSGLGI